MNELLHVARLVTSVRLFEWVFVIVAAILTYVLARRDAELALSQVKELQGLLPICAYCKKIRDDRNYWQAIEDYVVERSRATFTHGICPECKAKVLGSLGR